MNLIAFVFFIILASVALLYFAMLFYLLAGWIRCKKQPSADLSYLTKVSVVIAVRNEEKIIESCLRDICNQDYPANLMEIIVVNDDSVDGTGAAIRKMSAQARQPAIQIIELKQDIRCVAHKKRALTEGICVAAHELIVTTDGDCRMGRQWISSLVGAYEKNCPSMIVAPVIAGNLTNGFMNIQALDMLGLAVTACGSVSVHQPLLCNGANLMFRKNDFLRLGGYRDNEHIPSGDDIFLMLKFHRAGLPLEYLKSEKAVVYTSPQKTLPQYIAQRSRWISKVLGIKDPAYKTASALTFIFYLLLLGSAVLLFISWEFCKCWLLVLTLKGATEFLFLASAARCFKQKKLLLWFLPQQIFNLVYVVMGTIWSAFMPCEWRGRRIPGWATSVARIYAASPKETY